MLIIGNFLHVLLYSYIQYFWNKINDQYWTRETSFHTHSPVQARVAIYLLSFKHELELFSLIFYILNDNKL